MGSGLKLNEWRELRAVHTPGRGCLGQPQNHSSSGAVRQAGEAGPQPGSFHLAHTGALRHINSAQSPAVCTVYGVVSLGSLYRCGAAAHMGPYITQPHAPWHSTTSELGHLYASPKAKVRYDDGWDKNSLFSFHFCLKGGRKDPHFEKEGWVKGGHGERLCGWVMRV